MAKHVYMVLANPVDGREDEFNDWYDNTHLADLLRLGFSSARRFKLTPGQDGEQRYLALYEIDTDDVEAVGKRLVDAAGTPALMLSPALDLTSMRMGFFQQIAEA